MNYNILCVDDVENNLFVIKNILENVNGYTIFTALSGQEAFDIILKHRVDLIMLDIMMPEMDGFEVARLLKQNSMTKDIPIIFVTAKTDEQSLKEAFDRGGIDYIVKPYRDYELLARVKMHLELYQAQLEIKREQELLKEILNQQDNLIIITNGKKIEKANESFLRFFDISNIDDLNYSIESIIELFELEQKLDMSSNSWLDEIYTNKSIDFTATIKGKLEESTFLLKVSKMDDDDLYIISFTDITNTILVSKKLEERAFYDTLTKIYNREKLNEFLTYEIDVANRYSTELSIIIFDIDNFKVINDSYGHITGDHVLRHLSMFVKNSIRKTDLLARWGGEEFIIVATSTSINSATIVAENIRELINEDDFPEVGKISCSFGVASYIRGESMESFIERADKALYRAKKSGKNRVCVQE
jgi:diguanylate cyclase (GGDEF)-like protein